MIDPSFQIIRIVNSYLDCSSTSLNCKYAADSETESLRAPALSVMLFLSENGIMNSTEVQKSFKRRPWKFHHKVELQSRRTPDRPAASQEFFGIADNLPLWAVCPVHCGNEHLRFLFHVRNFREMVEFYRIITDCEMESNKPGFCIFQLYSQPGLDIQLALKHSEHISPYSVKNAILNFKIKNLANLRTSLQSVISRVGKNLYSITDPDGNIIHLQEQESGEPEIVHNQVNVKTFSDDVKSVKSVRSSSDSHDSGRCSDSEIWFSEVEVLSKLDHVKGTKNYTCTSNDTTAGIKFSDKRHTDFGKNRKVSDCITKLSYDVKEHRSTGKHQSKLKVDPVYL